MSCEYGCQAGSGRDIPETQETFAVMKASLAGLLNNFTHDWDSEFHPAYCRAACDYVQNAQILDGRERAWCLLLPAARKVDMEEMENILRLKTGNR